MAFASKILAKPTEQLLHDWKQRYDYQPVLLEPFVDSLRHGGICYKTAKWQRISRTAGRGKKSQTGEQLLPTKDIRVYPLSFALNRSAKELPHLATCILALYLEIFAVTVRHLHIPPRLVAALATRRFALSVGR